MLNCFNMTHFMMYNRTPKRSIDSDDLDEAPSSKRMKTKNHLDPGADYSSQDSTMSYAANSVFLNPPKVQGPVGQVRSPEFQNSICTTQNNMAYHQHQEEYSVTQSDLKYLPYLSAEENPHYYENNRLLFELYVERIRRVPSAAVGPSQNLSF